MKEQSRPHSFDLLRELFRLPKFFQNSCDLILVAIGIHILSLALPLTLMQTYDRIIPNRAVGTLIWLLVGCIVALITEYAFRIIRALISNWMSARFEHHISTLVVDKLLDSTIGEFESVRTAIHLDRINAVGTLKGFYSGQLLLLLFDLPFSLVFLYTVYYLGNEVVFVPILSIFFLFLIILVTKFGYQKNKILQIESVNNRVNFLLEMLGGIRVAKGLALEEQMLRRHEYFQSQVTLANMRLGFWNAIPMNIGFTFSQLNMFGVIVVGAEQVIAGSMTVGTLTACSMLGARALQPVQGALFFWLRYSDAEIANEKIQQIAAMDYENPRANLEPLPNHFHGSIEFHKVAFQHKKSPRFLFEDLSLKIKENEMVCFQGSAQTAALLMLIHGRLRATRGKIIIGDYNIEKWDLSQVHGQIEYIPRHGTLFQGTILENITLFSPHRKTAALEAAKLMGLDEDIARLPLGYETETGLQGNLLFTSDLIQRICLARALVTRPGIMIFDNAEVTLDPQHLGLYRTLLQRLKGKTTIIFISNQAGLRSLADRSYQFEQGRLV